jgi:hypothetical protein
LTHKYLHKCLLLPKVYTNHTKHNTHDLLGVAISANTFYLNNIYGNAASWQAFGNFIDSLHIQRQVLPIDLKTTIHQITDTIQDNLQKIRLIYNYVMQQSFYKSIQLGLGGWQPATVTDTWQKKYGDCKALSLVFKACLQEVGIESYYTLVHLVNDTQPFIADFPSNQFTHVIITVPLDNAHLFIECTQKQHDITQTPLHLMQATGLVVRPNNKSYILAIK